MPKKKIRDLQNDLREAGFVNDHQKALTASTNIQTFLASLLWLVPKAMTQKNTKNAKSQKSLPDPKEKTSLVS